MDDKFAHTTTGPWSSTSNEHGAFTVVQAHGGPVICERTALWHVSGRIAESRANAELIAAAPAMLAYVRECAEAGCGIASGLLREPLAPAGELAEPATEVAAA